VISFCLAFWCLAFWYYVVIKLGKSYTGFKKFFLSFVAFLVFIVIWTILDILLTPAPKFVAPVAPGIGAGV
jgi:hypothetical protein